MTDGRSRAKSEKKGCPVSRTGSRYVEVVPACRVRRPITTVMTVAGRQGLPQLLTVTEKERGERHARQTVY